MDILKVNGYIFTTGPEDLLVWDLISMYVGKVIVFIFFTIILAIAIAQTVFDAHKKITQNKKLLNNRCHTQTNILRPNSTYRNISLTIKTVNKDSIRPQLLDPPPIVDEHITPQHHVHMIIPHSCHKYLGSLGSIVFSPQKNENTYENELYADVNIWSIFMMGWGNEVLCTFINFSLNYVNKSSKQILCSLSTSRLGQLL